MTIVCSRLVGSPANVERAVISSAIKAASYFYFAALTRKRNMSSNRYDIAFGFTRTLPKILIMYF